MSAEFFDILPPPQSIETLDNWGTLDTLPYSLDDAAWQRIGVYGLRVEATAHSSEKQGSDSVIRGLELVGEAYSGGALTGFKVTYLSGHSEAASSELAGYIVVRDVQGRATEQTPAAASYIVIRDVRGKAVGKAGAAGDGVKVSYLSGNARAESQGGLDAKYTRSLNGLSGATTHGDMVVGRVLMLEGAAHAQSAENVLLEYKGWNWDKEERPSAPLWEQKEALPYPWHQKMANAAEWAVQSIGPQGWTQKSRGAAQWR